MERGGAGGRAEGRAGGGRLNGEWGSAAWRSSELPAPRAAAAKGLSSSVGYFNWFHMEFVRFED